MIVQRAAVICEFNPFHNGHKFLLEKIKEEFADEVVCIMSGSFVQRGDIAITDKYARARTALENGADMVAELPTVYAVSAAQVFAKSGVQIAYELGCEKLCFGSENSLEELYSLLDVLDAQETQKKIAGYMNDGDYYPLALSKAVGNDLSEIICKPNNILALEYIRACRSYGIEPIAIKRIGVGHDDTEVCGNIASATKIRELLINGEDCSPYTPMRISEPCQLSDIDQIICYLLRSKNPAEAVRLLREAGIANISIDLIYAFPGESLAQWHDDVLQALLLDVEHISAYALSYEEGTPLERMLREGRVNEADEELQRQMYYDLKDLLEAAGYEHYEISNFARQGFRSRHNSSYWNHTPYIGLGAGAHSFDGRRRQWNVAHLDQYIRAIGEGRLPAEGEEIDAVTYYNETVMTALRTCEGIDLSALTDGQRQSCLRQAQRYMEGGLLAIKGNRLVLTREGLFVSDMVMSDLMAL